jgi:hypothetical protein
MSKAATKAESQQAKQTQQKNKLTAATEHSSGDSALTGWADSPMVRPDGGSVQSRTPRLGDKRIQTAQRQAVARELNRVFGNQHLQRAITPRLSGVPTISMKVIQRDGDTLTSRLGGGTHQVIRGESLAGIARDTYGDSRYWEEIYRANPDRIGSGGNLILIGSELILPQIDVEVASIEPPLNRESSAGSPIASGGVPTMQPPQTAGQQVSQANQSIVTSRSGQAGAKSLSRTCMMPAFRYRLGDIPVSFAPFLTPSGLLVFTLSLRGDFTAQQQGSCLPWSIDQTGLRVEANEVIGQFVAGIRINSIGSDSMSLGATFAGEFNSSEVRYTSPNTWTFIAQSRNIGFEFGGWNVTGNFGYSMRVDFIPTPPVQERPTMPQPEFSWNSIFAYAVAAGLTVGALALIAGTLAEDIATGGAGSVDDPITFAAAAKMLQMAGSVSGL